MQRMCAGCGSSFEVASEDLAFYDKVSPVIGGKKYAIPPPTHCPDCRQQRRLAASNELHLYPGTCGLCRKRIIRQYPPTVTKPIYCKECWNSDRWDPLAYGQEVDFNRPFFDQVREVRERTPEIALYVGPNIENCEYIHCADFSKNCYLIMHADYCEDCYYGYGFKKLKSCVDGYYNFSSELCYDCVDVHTCYALVGSQDCINCASSAFLRDCQGCKHCFCCVGLRNKEYCFENEVLSKSAYEERLAKINLGSWREYRVWRAKRRELELRHAFKEFQGTQLENCTGNHLYKCKNVRDSFDCEDTEDARFCCQVVTGAKDLYDIHQWGLNLQSSYECSHAGDNSYNVLFCVQTFLSASDVLYSWFMQGCKDCFGCAHLNRKQYCILNRQYEKSEYEELVPKIIDHMRRAGEYGEFFPLSLSPFGYNKSQAQLFYPLSREEALTRDLLWDDYEPPPPEVTKVIDASDLPDSISDTPDDILNWAIRCEITRKPFKLTKQELQFYRAQNLPIPRRSWLERHLDRFHQRNPRKFWNRSCAKCQKPIATTYAPDRPEIVFCEQCYLQLVY